MENLIQDIKDSLHKGFINKAIEKRGRFLPKLLINTESENVLATIIDELYKCKSFSISVAFITESGLASLKMHLYELAQKGVKGRILTSNYLSFNSPKMYQVLLKLENVEVRVTRVSGFHAKGYIFDHEYHTSLIVGSSNLTSNALKVNYEHNILLSSHRNGDIVDKVKDQFDHLWNESDVLTPEWIESYRPIYRPRTFEKVLEVEKQQVEIQHQIQTAQKIVPNLMQEEALKSLAELRAQHEKRALIISATGTGKTIMSALDVRAYRPKRFLFIVHNEGILRRAMEDYQKVLADEPASAFGLLTGGRKDLDAKYIFATIQTISKQEIHEQLGPDYFDYIVYDEAHRIAAESYGRVLEYFKPNFLLGMTATPERNDTLNIFELFHYNIAYEIRLHQALENDMLCPFHYFGVTDFVLDDIKRDDTEMLQYLTSDERVRYILERTHYFGYSGERLQGLIFASNVDEAEKLATKLTEFGYPTEYLVGKHTQQHRQEVIQRLRSGDISYIITVDLFNEGIDIPEVNQVVMLRATESSIVFIQQLGRGLRKSDNKDFVTVIDFIGNYKKNYLIPVALSGDQSQNRDNYRKFLTDTTVLQGVSTINFTNVAKQKIFDALNEASLDHKNVLKEAYITVKKRIGHMPMLMDFIQQNSIDPMVILQKYGNYHKFLIEINKTKHVLPKDAEQNLTFLSKELGSGLRIIEQVMIRYLLNGPATKDEILRHAQQFDSTFSIKDIEGAIRILSYTFYGKGFSKTNGPPIIEIEDETLHLNQVLTSNMKNPIFKRYFDDIMNFIEYHYHQRQLGLNQLILYNKYSRYDFTRIMNWEKNGSSYVFGYTVKNNAVPIFITYHKGESFTETTRYLDTFLNQSELKWYTKSKRTIESNQESQIINHKDNNLTLYIFVQKEEMEKTDFYYLGTVQVIDSTVEETTMVNGDAVVTMHLALDTPVRDDIYRYLIEK
ncbi:DUF3427 domain-containing protein [Staphylococcus canis]|uniref:DEAD/DEAH box helicase n=1 Tax=Staphylococcus canis TaxID=2724942 RepID=A0ABS0T7L6_9STAP|nr:DEAD/DEAH box helicase [Staphylococcus canis]MBI5974407.1 DEAD/DEAH box helicase [Staphylococcus canis]